MKEVFIRRDMENIGLFFDEDKINICVDDRNIGIIAYSFNPYHAESYYLELQLQQYDAQISMCIFDKISQRLNKSMQIMISSDESELSEFISQAGFVCKRKCYEIEADVQDYIGEQINGPLAIALDNEVVYQICRKMMLERYISTHKIINPWTGTETEFYEALPKAVYYEVENRQVINIAFIEGNEIAYVCGTDIDKFTIFAQNLVTKLFDKYENIVFEADDCDEYAMKLKSLFNNQSEVSYDTYIRK